MQPSPNQLSKAVAKQYAEEGVALTGKAVVHIAAGDLHFKCSRASAYRAIGLAKEIVHVSLGFEYCLVEPYRYLHWFVELNPQSVTFTNFSNDDHFIRAGLGPSVSRDFLQSALPVKAINMSHLYMPIKGQLALAVGMDGNKQIFPFFGGYS